MATATRPPVVAKESPDAVVARGSPVERAVAIAVAQAVALAIGPASAVVRREGRARA